MEREKAVKKFRAKTAVKSNPREISLSGLIRVKCARELLKWRTDSKFPFSSGKLDNGAILLRI